LDPDNRLIVVVLASPVPYASTTLVACLSPLNVVRNEIAVVGEFERAARDRQGAGLPRDLLERGRHSCLGRLSPESSRAATNDAGGVSTKLLGTPLFGVRFSVSYRDRPISVDHPTGRIDGAQDTRQDRQGASSFVMKDR
jgi:hypothetical protein